MKKRFFYFTICLIFTNGLGPIFVKNPWWTEKIIKEAMKNKGIEIKNNIDKSTFQIEHNSNESIKIFIDSKKNKKIN